MTLSAFTSLIAHAQISVIRDEKEQKSQNGIKKQLYFDQESSVDFDPFSAMLDVPIIPALVQKLYCFRTRNFGVYEYSMPTIKLYEI